MAGAIVEVVVVLVVVDVVVEVLVVVDVLVDAEVDAASVVLVTAVDTGATDEGVSVDGAAAGRSVFAVEQARQVVASPMTRVVSAVRRMATGAA